MLSQYASLDAKYEAMLKQAKSANNELTKRIESDVSIKLCIILINCGTTQRRGKKIRNIQRKSIRS